MNSSGRSLQVELGQRWVKVSVRSLECTMYKFKNLYMSDRLIVLCCKLRRGHYCQYNNLRCTVNNRFTQCLARCNWGSLDPNKSKQYRLHLSCRTLGRMSVERSCSCLGCQLMCSKLLMDHKVYTLLSLVWPNIHCSSKHINLVRSKLSIHRLWCLLERSLCPMRNNLGCNMQ
jgi:hypothetical protein